MGIVRKSSEVFTLVKNFNEFKKMLREKTMTPFSFSIEYTKKIEPKDIVLQANIKDKSRQIEREYLETEHKDINFLRLNVDFIEEGFHILAIYISCYYNDKIRSSRFTVAYNYYKINRDKQESFILLPLSKNDLIQHTTGLIVAVHSNKGWFTSSFDTIDKTNLQLLSYAYEMKNKYIVSDERTNSLLINQFNFDKNEGDHISSATTTDTTTRKPE